MTQLTLTLKMTTAQVGETSGLRSPGRSCFTYLWNDYLVQTFHCFFFFKKNKLFIIENHHGLRSRQKGKRNAKDLRWFLITPSIPQSLAILKRIALRNLHLTKKNIEELRTTAALLQSVYSRGMI